MDTGADTLGSGFHLWKRRTAMKDYPDVPGRDVALAALVVAISLLITLGLWIWFHP